MMIVKNAPALPAAAPPRAAAVAALTGGASAQPTAAQSTESRAALFLPAGRGFDWSWAGVNDSQIQTLANPSVKYDVKAAFGAKGDGTTDDTAALQAAVAAANAKPGVVLLPAGTYLLSAPLVVTSGKVVIRGAGVSSGGGARGGGVRCGVAFLECFPPDGRRRPPAALPHPSLLVRCRRESQRCTSPGRWQMCTRAAGRSTPWVGAPPVRWQQSLVPKNTEEEWELHEAHALLIMHCIASDVLAGNLQSLWSTGGAFFQFT